MALVHNGTILFGNNTHSNIVEGNYDPQIRIGQYTGLIGESHLIGRTKGRDLFCEVDAFNYSTRANLNNALTTIQGYANTPLFGTLRVIYANGTYDDYVNCTFITATKSQEGIMYEPSTGTYRAKILFTWRQAS